MPTYITLKDVKKRWGHGQEDVFPVAQFEKLWGDMTALPEIDSQLRRRPARARPATQRPGATRRLAARRLGRLRGVDLRVDVIYSLGPHFSTEPEARPSWGDSVKQVVASTLSGF